MYVYAQNSGSIYSDEVLLKLTFVCFATHDWPTLLCIKVRTYIHTYVCMYIYAYVQDHTLCSCASVFSHIHMRMRIEGLCVFMCMGSVLHTYV